MRKRNLKNRRLSAFIVLTCAASAIVVSVFLHNQKIIEEQPEKCVLEQLVKTEKEPELELEDWMLNLELWDNKKLERIEPIAIKSNLTEKNFSLVNGKFVNLFAEEDEPDIPLEEWMLSPKKMMENM